MAPRNRAILILAGALVLALVVPLPRSGYRFGAYVGDLFHGPVFAVLTVLLCRALLMWRVENRWIAAAAAWVALVAFGVATEVVQYFVGRNMSGHDLLADAAGATAGVLWELGRGQHWPAARRGLALAAALVLVLTAARPVLLLADCYWQHAEMPMLASFEHPLELSRWAPAESRLDRVQQHATDGQWSLRVDLAAGTYPGVSMMWTPRDWTGYSELAFDVHLDDGPPLAVVVKIVDEQTSWDASDRFERTVRLVPGENGVRIALAEVAAAPADRALDLTRVFLFQIFTVHPDRPRTLHLDHVHLR